MGGFLSTVSQTIGHEFDPFNINSKATFFFSALTWNEEAAYRFLSIYANDKGFLVMARILQIIDKPFFLNEFI